ncbi:MAG: hypothetical protein IJ443_09165 [Firmicutes bacterium]|nr:hypothetical protein [Bacillota bacterium]
MKTEQYVMAYGAEQDRLRAILPEGFVSLRPVLRINAEIRDDASGYVEFNTAVEKDGIRGWLNIGCWEDVPFEKAGKTVTFHTDCLTISFTGVGVQGSCPAEKDNGGCFFLSKSPQLRLPEVITSDKEFCDCDFAWNLGGCGAHGRSIGKTLPAVPTEPKVSYPKQAFTVENAAAIPCDQVLGSYVVIFTR